MTNEQRKQYKNSSRQRFDDETLFGRNLEHKKNAMAGTKVLGKFCTEEKWKSYKPWARSRANNIYKHATKEGIMS